MEEFVQSEVSDTGINYPDQEPDCQMVQHLFSRIQRRLREAGCGQRNDGFKGSPSSGRHCDAWRRGNQSDMAKREAESSRIEEGKDPGK